jgi:hypothetical protein
MAPSEPLEATKAHKEEIEEAEDQRDDKAEEGEIEAEDRGSDNEDNSEDDETSGRNGAADAPPLPEEAIPPLPEEPSSAASEQDDGWAPIWEETAQTFYFYNRFTGATQWSNPRVPDAPTAVASDVVAPLPAETEPPLPAARPTGGYDPAIHGDYDENAWYAQSASQEASAPAPTADAAVAYAATAAFNRFTGRYQAADITPENYNDENKSKRQMNAFFDVDAAANSHDGRSLKEERSGKKLTKAELKQFKEKRKARKEEKRRAWLMD